MTPHPYQQLVDRLRFAIATGELAPGSVLPSLRSGAQEYGVHLHTVRRAYHELAQAGLVRVDARRGTIVLPVVGAQSSLDAFLGEMLAAAQQRYGLSNAEVVAALERRRSASTPTVSVAECSRTLAGSIARQIAQRWRVTAVPHVLGDGALPNGRLISTYFHYREVTAATAQRPGDVTYVRIAIARALVATLLRARSTGRLRHLVLRETDAQLGQQVAGALQYALRDQVEIEVQVTATGAPVAAPPAGQMLLLSPRQWDALPASALPPRVALLEYDVDPTDLEGLGPVHGWVPVPPRR
ncbi:MAG: GntR family transcriptional regulator [Gemmatimonadaceae bacterium]|nr:GntR family transcriptional regulator [Gemmatimonadaceae bacterium]MCW5826867.1 GntR family transcriptional regulator [Gemmatimonadaceae bacterium]